MKKNYAVKDVCRCGVAHDSIEHGILVEQYVITSLANLLCLFSSLINGITKNIKRTKKRIFEAILNHFCRVMLELTI